MVTVRVGGVFSRGPGSSHPVKDIFLLDQRGLWGADTGAQEQPSFGKEERASCVILASVMRPYLLLGHLLWDRPEPVLAP